MGGQPQTPNAPVLSRSSALRGSAAVVLLLSCATMAFAQTGELQHTTRDPSRGVTLPPTGAALVDESTAPVVNPAGTKRLDVTCEHVTVALQAVRRLPGVRTATVFGQSMHLLVEDSVSEQFIRERLDGVGIRQTDIRPIAPSLEDVFVALTNRNGNGR